MKNAALQSVLFTLIAATITFLHLLPLELRADAGVWPDLLFALAAAWVLRRPDSTPVALIIAIFLAADFILSRPPGLWTFLVLMATEFLRVQSRGHHERPFLFEWITFAAVFAVMLLVQSLMLALALVPNPPTGRMLTQYGLTVGLYPLVTFTLYGILRVRAPAAEHRGLGGVA
ncbi:rod shape-determining protein MreD [Algicella marina]|uniref:Rod shape-determining protein MreD n=1 Tax=Algicella marina TaxID=2683284 RepID=A0A6P1T2F8_9RHOB|nr:rod shape-determining protein MreD [Algicella marina]QHQ35499.1 rod shape-determining protein MreD [Algicella marina]